MSTKLPAPGDPKALYVLDLSGYVFRAYHALPPLSNSKGEPTHAVFGVAQMLHRLVREQRPRYLAVAMDSKTDTGFRKRLYPAYKANRPAPPPDLSRQMERCRELAEAYAIPVLQQEGYEADDLIAACVREARKHGLTTVICSADKDLMQLVADDVILWDTMRNQVYGPAEVRQKWGVGPEQICDLLALMGDSSDNVPGVAGVGEKTAAKLVSQYGSLSGVYANIDQIKGKLKENLLRDQDKAKLSYELVCLNQEVPVTLDLEALRYGGWDDKRLRALFSELEFNRLLEALGEEQKSGSETNTASSNDPPQTVSSIGIVESTASKRYEVVLTREALNNCVEACRTKGTFALDTETTSLDAWRAELVGISLAWEPDHGVYIPIGHRVIGDPPQLPKDTVLEALRPLFADPTVKKVGHNIKYDDMVLRRAGVPVRGYQFDTMIASYLIDPEKHSHRLDEIARSELGYEMLTYDTVTRRERGRQITFDEVDIATATRYSAEDADIALQLFYKLRSRVEEDPALRTLMYDVEVPLALVLSRMEEHGVLVDVEALRSLSEAIGRELESLERELHELAGREFNVNSPRQLETILFDELKLPVIKRTKTSRSTDAEVLEELSDRSPLAAKILEYRSLAKLKGTYLDALPALVDPATGRIHTSYNQAVAATGRLSSNNPNLQNIPIRTETGRKIRRAFIAPTGCRILSADYSQIELRVLAHLSKDPILIDAFRNNEDVHTRTAMEIFKVTKDQVTRAMRSRAKTTNFAVIYGQGEAALARQLGMSREEAANFIQKYFETFSGLARYLEDVVARARAGEGVRTLLGRRRFLPTIRSENRGLRAQAERMAKNTPIQGTAADIMKVAMVRVARALEEQGLQSRMILTVHDELVFEVPEYEEKSVGELVREAMENAVKLDVPLVVELGWGANWGEAHE